MNILVTGGAGFIGNHLCEALIKSNIGRVICIDNFNDFYDPRIKENNIKYCLSSRMFKLYRADITSIEETEKIFRNEKIDRIFHLAARAGIRYSFKNPLLYEEVNVKGTINLLNLAVKYKIRNFTLASSSSVYGANKKIPFSEEDNVDNPLSPYAITKRSAELLCKIYSEMHGLNVTCFRFFTVYGPRGRPDMAPYKFTKQISQGQPIEMYGDGSSKRDYTYISDIINGLVNSLEKNFKFEIINLGNSKPVELRKLIALIEKNIGKKAKINKMQKQPGEVDVTYADIKKAKKLLGYQPKIEIEDGIAKFGQWFKQQPTLLA